MGKAGGLSRDAMDRALRGRIAEIMSAAGVDRSRISQEVLFELPGSFVRAYELLHDRALHGVDREARSDAEVGRVDDPDNKGGGGGGRLKDTERSRERYGEVVVRSGGSSRRAARGASRGGAAGLSLGEEVALELKTRIDKRLRGMAREIMAELAEAGIGVDGETGEMMVRVDADRLALLRNREGGHAMADDRRVIDDAT